MGYLSCTDYLELDLYKVQPVCIRDAQDCHSDVKGCMEWGGGGEVFEAVVTLRALVGINCLILLQKRGQNWCHGLIIVKTNGLF